MSVSQNKMMNNKWWFVLYVVPMSCVWLGYQLAESYHQTTTEQQSVPLAAAAIYISMCAQPWVCLSFGSFPSVSLLARSPFNLYILDIQGVTRNWTKVLTYCLVQFTCLEFNLGFYIYQHGDIKLSKYKHFIKLELLKRILFL